MNIDGIIRKSIDNEYIKFNDYNDSVDDGSGGKQSANFYRTR